MIQHSVTENYASFSVSFFFSIVFNSCLWSLTLTVRLLATLKFYVCSVLQRLLANDEETSKSIMDEIKFLVLFMIMFYTTYCTCMSISYEKL